MERLDTLSFSSDGEWLVIGNVHQTWMFRLPSGPPVGPVSTYEWTQAEWNKHAPRTIRIAPDGWAGGERSGLRTYAGRGDRWLRDGRLVTSGPYVWERE